VPVDLDNTAAMSSSPAPKQLKRRERVINRIQDFLKPTSRPPPPPSRSAPDLTEGNNSSSPSPSPSLNLPPIAPAPAQTPGPTGQTKAPSMSSAGRALSTTTTASLATPAAPTTADKHSGTWSVAWSSLENALRLLERTADVFPPLKSAVSGLLACLDLIQASYDCRFTTEDDV